MKKKNIFPTWIEFVVPVLPLLPNLVSLKLGLLIGCSAAAVFLVLAIISKFISCILEKNKLSFVYMTAAAAAVYILNGFYELPISLVLSLCLMGPQYEAQKKFNPKISSIFLRALCFAGLIFYLVFSQEVLGGIFHQSFFQRVTGTFALLILPAFFWPVSRKKKAGTRKKIYFEEIPAI